MQQTILSIAGKPGLFKLVSRGRANLIVESLDEQHKRMPAFSTDRVTSLSDIAMYTDAEDVPLMKILASLRDKEQGKEVSINYKKASSKELRDYFAEILPKRKKKRKRKKKNPPSKRVLFYATIYYLTFSFYLVPTKISTAP